MPHDAATIDRIVAGVLEQLGRPASAPSQSDIGTAAIADAVITAASLESLDTESSVQVDARAILTPSAHDVVRSRRLQIVRADGSPGSDGENTSPAIAVVVVQPTSALERVLAESGLAFSRESCPDVAAETLARQIADKHPPAGIVFATAVHRVAMLGNRHKGVRAAAVADLQCAKAAKEQIRANLWGINPDGRSDFELKNLLRFVLQ